MMSLSLTATRPMSGRAVKKPRTESPATRHGAGLLRPRTRGSTASASCSFATKRKTKITSPLSTSLSLLPAGARSGLFTDRPLIGINSYASSSEVVREALRDWKMKRALQLQELAALKADIDRGLMDLAEGRVQDFDTARLIERGRKLLAGRSPSA